VRFRSTWIVVGSLVARLQGLADEPFRDFHLNRVHGFPDDDTAFSDSWPLDELAIEAGAV